MKRALLLLFLLLVGTPLRADAAEFRAFRPILTSAAAPAAGKALAPAAVKPVSYQLVAKAVDKIVAAWNSNQIDRVLGDDFFDKERLVDTMNSKVPRDARLSVLGIQGVQTLSQSTEELPSGRLLVSMVSVVVKTQLTFNDPAKGYQRREGTNELILRIKQYAPR